jgi:hypothetical protein
LAHRCASIIKNHFAAEFFLNEEGEFVVRDLCKVLYIVRNSVDVMISFNKYVNHMRWHEGPKNRSAAEFASTPPEGRMLPYQYAQAPSILERWKRHVLGWTKIAESNPNVSVLTYRELDSDFEETARNLLSFLGCTSCTDSVERPDCSAHTARVPVHEDVVPADRSELIARVSAAVADDTIASRFPGLVH